MLPAALPAPRGTRQKNDPEVTAEESFWTSYKLGRQKWEVRATKESALERNAIPQRRKHRIEAKMEPRSACKCLPAIEQLTGEGHEHKQKDISKRREAEL